MIDYTEYFKEQIAASKPFTDGNLRSMKAILAMHRTAKELMAESKRLKAKIGMKRLHYTTIEKVGEVGTRSHVWDDEMSSLVTLLAGYEYSGHTNNEPIFTRREQVTKE